MSKAQAEATWPEELARAWDEKQGPAVFATTSSHDGPNVIYITWAMPWQNTILIVDNYFDKTRANIMQGSRGALAFLTRGGSSYQVKGRISYHVTGAACDAMRSWLPTRCPGHGAALLHIEEVYRNHYGAERIA